MFFVPVESLLFLPWFVVVGGGGVGGGGGDGGGVGGGGGGGVGGSGVEGVVVLVEKFSESRQY